MRELICQGLNFESTDTDAQKLTKLTHRLGSDGLPTAVALPMLASFLGIESGVAAQMLSAEALREQTMKLLVAWGVSMSAEQPVLMLVEDIHWCDPSSLEFLSRLIAGTPRDRLFLLMTTRPGLQPPWQALPNFTAVNLGGLPAEQARVMVQHLCANAALPQAAYDRIVTRADGVPLHVEELTRMIQESRLGQAGQAVDELSIPETLEGSLMARLDQLNGAKNVAQVASLIGREFDYGLLEAVSQMEPAALSTALDQLVSASLIFARQSGRDVRYIFKHALIQDASYQSMLKSNRREYHGRTARALLQSHAALADRQPELVARHFMEAEDWLPAAQYGLRAGEHAVRTSANKEAITYLQSA